MISENKRDRNTRYLVPTPTPRGVLVARVSPGPHQVFTQRGCVLFRQTRELPRGAQGRLRMRLEGTANARLKKEKLCSILHSYFLL